MTPPYPDVLDPTLVGSYPAFAMSGGGYVWDAVLEYRVWCHPVRGAEDLDDGSDYYYSFASFAEAQAFAEATVGTEKPLALIVQEEYIDEPSPGKYRHVKKRRGQSGKSSFFLVRAGRRARFQISFLRMRRRTGLRSFAGKLERADGER